MILNHYHEGVQHGVYKLKNKEKHRLVFTSQSNASQTNLNVC